MGGEKLQYHPAEDIPNEELFEAETLGYHALEAYLQERMSCLRATVFAKLSQHHALVNNELSWAIFLVDQSDVSSDLTTYPDKED